MASSENGCPPRIQPLPQEVVDRIAAGEVIQRPCSVVKELIENSLDAGSSSITVHVEQGGMTKLQVIDNGSGIARDDLALAATRFATSKLRSTADFDTLSSFGFRGEALASMSLVARLNIVSRRTKMGFSMSYQNGSPTTKSPTPKARTQGTTVTVSDLFYNLKHRKKLKERDEYNKILAVVQHYAVEYPYVGFVCRKLHGKKKQQVVDLNTSMLSSVKALQKVVSSSSKQDVKVPLRDDATKAVIINVFGSSVKNHLIKFDCQQSDNFNFDFSFQGFVTGPSYSASHSTKLVMFVNSRWVECPPLKSALEQTYCEFAKEKPLLYISLRLPATEVDVNVHPSKKQVTMLHQDAIIENICASLKMLLQSQGRSFSVDAAKPPSDRPSPVLRSESLPSPKRPRPENQENPSTQLPPRPKKQQVLKSSQKVRTTRAAPAGALEPFLVPKSQPQSTDEGETATNKPASITTTSVEHVSGCPLSKDSVDLSQPGAFAKKCNCVALIHKRRVQPMRVPKIVPTQCAYKSIRSLRSQLTKRRDEQLQKQLRKDAIFVGTLSDQRSLVQCGVELQLWHHGRLAEELFRQLALLRFGGMPRAVFPQPIDIQRTIGFVLELEGSLSASGVVLESVEVDHVGETNKELAKQATLCLLDNSAMLEDYFEIGISKDKDDGPVYLKAMPVLLEGHSPQPSGLGLFLLRLATEVDWTDEKPCFHGVSRELGLYYGKVPESRVQHCLFPAICHILIPSSNMLHEKTVSKLTTLAMLYRQFERGS